jgi:hypothetical protein
MSYQQPGGWHDPSWSASNQPSSVPGHQGYPGFPVSASPAPTPGYDPNPYTNQLAVASLVTADRESMMQTLLPYLRKRNGVALAGIIIGWIGFVLWLGFWVPFAWGFFGAATGH